MRHFSAERLLRSLQSSVSISGRLVAETSGQLLPHCKHLWAKYSEDRCQSTETGVHPFILSLPPRIARKKRVQAKSIVAPRRLVTCPEKLTRLSDLLDAGQCNVGAVSRTT